MKRVKCASKMNSKAQRRLYEFQMMDFRANFAKNIPKRWRLLSADWGYKGQLAMCKTCKRGCFRWYCSPHFKPHFRRTMPQCSMEYGWIGGGAHFEEILRAGRYCRDSGQLSNICLKLDLICIIELDANSHWAEKINTLSRFHHQPHIYFKKQVWNKVYNDEPNQFISTDSCQGWNKVICLGFTEFLPLCLLQLVLP